MMDILHQSDENETNHTGELTMTFTIRVKAFTGTSVGTHRVSAEDGIVRVWDAVAGHYTTCHCMSARTIARILRMAAAE